MVAGGITGAEVQKRLATVVIGGLLTATLLTLVVLPALYARFAAPAPTQRGDKSRDRDGTVRMRKVRLSTVTVKASAA